MIKTSNSTDNPLADIVGTDAHGVRVSAMVTALNSEDPIALRRALLELVGPASLPHANILAGPDPAVAKAVGPIETHRELRTTAQLAFEAVAAPLFPSKTANEFR